MLEYYAGLSHNDTTSGFTVNTPEDTLFGSNNTCALVPETTIGPYYVTGEYLRSDITEGQVGVPSKSGLLCPASHSFWILLRSVGAGMGLVMP